MKNLLLFLIPLITLACSGTKTVVESPQKEVVQIEKAADSIVKITHKDLGETETIETTTTEIDTINKESVDKDNSNESLQEVEKRPIANHEIWDNLLKQHVSINGNVDYKGFKKERAKLYNYFKTLNLSVPNKTDSKEYTLAYWINAYNAFTIDLILRHYPIKSIKDIKDPWGQRFWKLGEKWYNLEDIEHQILRNMNEPRIHFAIVCASYSCPKLQNEAFQVSNLEVQLTKATKDFLSDSNRNSISENEIEISKIFQWFAKDFKQDGSLIDFLNKYSEITISNKAKKHFKDYNWDLNE